LKFEPSELPFIGMEEYREEEEEEEDEEEEVEEEADMEDGDVGEDEESRSNNRRQPHPMIRYLTVCEVRGLLSVPV
jgi:hypothetical protein